MFRHGRRLVVDISEGKKDFICQGYHSLLNKDRSSMHVSNTWARADSRRSRRARSSRPRGRTLVLVAVYLTTVAIRNHCRFFSKTITTRGGSNGDEFVGNCSKGVRELWFICSISSSSSLTSRVQDAKAKVPTLIFRLLKVCTWAFVELVHEAMQIVMPTTGNLKSTELEWQG